MKTTIFSFLLSIVLFSCDEELSQDDAMRRRLAERESSNSDNPGVGNGNSTDAPIDGGLSILLVAGAAYGAKRIHAARKQQKEDAGKNS